MHIWRPALLYMTKRCSLSSWSGLREDNILGDHFWTCTARYRRSCQFGRHRCWDCSSILFCSCCNSLRTGKGTWTQDLPLAYRTSVHLTSELSACYDKWLMRRAWAIHSICVYLFVWIDFFSKVTVGESIVVGFAAVVANTFESYLGASVQGRVSWLTNDLVNVLQISVAAVMAICLSKLCLASWCQSHFTVSWRLLIAMILVDMWRQVNCSGLHIPLS
jgi:hypothetical protein